MSIEKEISDLLARGKAGQLDEQADKVGDGPKPAPGQTLNASAENADSGRNSVGSTKYTPGLNKKGSSDGKTATTMKAREKKYPSHFSAPGQTKESTEAAKDAIAELTMDDHLAALMEGETTLSEEFKTKAATIFEAVVVSRVKAEVERLEEEFEARLQEQFEETAEGLAEQVDGYLGLMIQKWLEDNELALESGMKSEILENFVSGLRNLFAESYIEVPEEKVDAFAAIEEELAEVKTLLDESVAMNVAMKKDLDAIERDSIINAIGDGMTDVELDKFAKLAEEVSFVDADSFATKLTVIRENYFKKKPGAASLTESVVSDTPVLTEEATPAKPVSGKMAAYAAALNKI
jgi:hypothetical protein